MGAHATWIWAAYGSTAAFVALEIWLTRRRHRRALRAAAAAEARRAEAAS